MPLPSRLLYAFLFSFFGALLTGAVAIPYLRKVKAGQVVRQEGPQAHLAKAGTPSMGGLIFLFPALLLTLILGVAGTTPAEQLATGAALLLTLGNGLLGFGDDFIKIVLRRPLGLRAREKLFGQLALAAALGYAAWRLHLGTWVQVPFTGWRLDLGWAYYLLVLILVWATTNAVNLADGLDGLLGGLSVPVFAVYGFVGVAGHQAGLAVLSFALLGGVIGFLKYNAHPARIFMGDTGSLGLGGALAALAVLTRTELTLVLLGGVFVLETASVILQVASFRLTGKRIFRMSPLHHHFELLGWPETAVVHRFWLAGLLCAVLAWWGLRGLLF